MEEIAAAIAAAEKQYRQRLQYYKQQQQPEQQHNGNPPFNMVTKTLLSYWVLVRNFSLQPHRSMPVYHYGKAPL